MVEGYAFQTFLVWIIMATLYWIVAGPLLVAVAQGHKAKPLALGIGVFVGAMFYGYFFIMGPFPMDVFELI